MTQRSGGVLATVLGTSAVAISALAGCNPLPGPALDPFYLKGGIQPGQAQTQPGPKGAASRTAGATVWVGRYRDSRGAGDVTVSLVQGASTFSGTWTLRTGGGGPLTGVLEAGGKRFQLRMENVAPGCPSVFEGWAELSETAFVGAYHGTDCEGSVSDGRLELRPRVSPRSHD